MGGMTEKGLKKLCWCTALLVLSGSAFSADEGSAAAVGSVASLARGDSKTPEVVEKNPIAALSDSLAGVVGKGAGADIPDVVRIDVPFGKGNGVAFDLNAGTITYAGNPVVYMKGDNGLEVFGNKAVHDTKKKTVTITGDVAIFRKKSPKMQIDSLTRASKAVYHTDTKLLYTSDVASRMDGLILRSGEFNYEVDEKGNQYLVGHDASITAEDDAEPETWISGREIKIYPEDSVSFTGLKAYSGGVPFFYFPYFYHSLNPREGYMPNIGAKSYWGAFLLNTYGVLFGNRRVEKGMPTADYIAISRVDYRTRRGLGLGVDFEDIGLNKKAANMTGLSLYGVDDRDPGISPVDEVRPGGLDTKRWRVALQNMWKLPVDDPGRGKWRLKANINALSDQYMLRDFYQELYERNSEPDNTVAIVRTGKTTSTTLLQRMPINDFYMSDQRTELSFDRIRAPIFDSSIMYESQSSAGFLRQYVPSFMRTDIRTRLDQMAANDPNRDFWERMLITDGFFRIHSYHELSSSFKVGRVLNIVPKVGGGYTGYRDVSDVGGFDQGIFYASTDAYIKFSKKYGNVRSRTFGVNSLTHVIQPYTTLAYTAANEADMLIPRIDGNTASTNPIALSPGRMTEIDAMATAAILRYGVKNFLMTERDGASMRWFSWDTFMDAYFHDSADNQNFSNLYSTMSWSPLPWLTYSNVAQFPVLGGDKDLRYREYNNYVSFMVTRSLDLIAGHRYLSQHPQLADSSQLDVQAIYRLTEELAVGGSWRWELKTGKMDIQEYNIYKNMGTWYFGMGIYMRKNGNKDEMGFGISFTLKETGAHMPIKFY